MLGIPNLILFAIIVAAAYTCPTNYTRGRDITPWAAAPRRGAPGGIPITRIDVWCT
ncbi:MAG: hypothetical protein U0768_13215 [Anaerolineae bacterium]